MNTGIKGYVPIAPRLFIPDEMYKKVFMKRKTWIYYAVNTAILCLSVILLLYKNFELMDMEGQSIKFQLVIVAWTAIIVHIIKSFRLFFVLYGSNIEGKLFLKAYCKVTPVSIILPFKLGEGYKMYCYGNLMGDYLKGVLSVLLDRFADTSALITILAVICLVYESRMIPLGYFLILFLILTVVLYFVFPGLYVFWSNYLLHSKASKSKIRGLKILHTLYTLHFEIRNVVEGRWTILYLISAMTSLFLPVSSYTIKIFISSPLSPETHQAETEINY